MIRDVRVGRSLVIPAEEIQLTFSTSGGPGGQHANKSATRVDLKWNVETSEALGPRQRTRLREALRRRIDSYGNIRLSAGRHRSQLRNIDDALNRLAEVVADGLRVRSPRVPTKTTAAAKRKRLESKRHRGRVKKLRATPEPD